MKSGKSDRRMRNTSKFISLILRHNPQVIGISLDEHGWADVQDLIEGINRTEGHSLDMDTLEEIVRTDEKQRYSFNEDKSKIRANQGHSIPGVVIEMEQPDPPELLYHGTATRFLSSIMQDGLKPMSRQYVHISPDFETAVKTGRRHGKPVILVIRAQDFVAVPG